MNTVRLARPFGVAVAALLITSCGASAETSPAVDTGEAGRFDLQATTRLALPAIDAGPTPLVVLVPGGGWFDADPTGLLPLADALSESGMVAATITYRAASDGEYHPVPAVDVACGAAHAARVATDSGFPPNEIVLVGHSSGAHLAALVALRPVDFSSGCADPGVSPDLLVGLAGPYDVIRAGGMAENLFGPDQTDPDIWSDGNPIDHADRRPDLAVLLVHGTADRVVPVRFTERFAADLADGGHIVTTAYPDDVDHHAVYSAEVAAPLITAWIGASLQGE